MKDWLKDLGRKAMEAGAAKVEDERQRWAEPPLTQKEDQLYFDFIPIMDLLPPETKQALPPFPGPVTGRNRREVRAFVNAPGFAQALALGIQIKEEKRRKEYAEAEIKQATEAKAEAERRQQELTDIGAFYGNELNVVEIPLRPLREMLSSGDYKSVRQEYHDEVMREKSMRSGTTSGLLLDTATLLTIGENFGTGLEQGAIRRTLRDFPEGHRAVMRLTDILLYLGRIDMTERYQIFLPLAWNDGKSQMTLPAAVSGPRERAAFMTALGRTILSRTGTAESAVEMVQAKCREALEDDMQASGRELMQRHLYSGTQWLNADAAAKLAPHGASDTALRLGTLPDGKELLYDLNQSLATVAPPGSGKSTSHVIRNLLYLKAPAVVLDIKGEVFAATGAWRQAAVGSVYRFAPTDPANSLHFNPFDFISSDEDLAFEQSQRLAELLCPPPEAKKGGDSYWDERAVQVVGAYVLQVAMTKTGAARSMDSVLDMLAGDMGSEPTSEEAEAGKKPDDGYDEILAGLMVSPIPRLRRLGTALYKLPQKQKEGIFDIARNMLSVWESPSIARLTRKTTFQPDQLRGENATLYLCVELGDIKRFAPVLRVLLGMTIHHLCTAAPEGGAKPVTVFLDELPRLRKMDVVEEALEMGRGFSVRLWLFMQNFGQLDTAYPNARGMLGNCLVRSYMNPEEDTAVWLSKHLGEQNGLLDGARKPLVPPYELTGEAFSDKIVVLLNGMDNAKLSKRPFYDDPEAKRRAGSAI